MKVALITGAANGIGLALSKICLEKDFTVIMVDINKAKLDVEVEQFKARYSPAILSYHCDITQPEQVQHLANTLKSEVSHIDWLFNNAGIIGNLSPIWEQESEQVQKVMEVNVFGMIHMLHSFMPLLFEQQKRAHIINMASLYAISSGSQLAPYSMSKHAVLALSESLHFDLQRLQKPIDVSVVLPSFTDTALLSQGKSNDISSFHHSLNSLLAHSRPAIDVATQIIHEVEQKKFYIFPDKEVKGYCEERSRAMVEQKSPHINNIEKLMLSLFKRSQKKRES